MLSCLEKEIINIRLANFCTVLILVSLDNLCNSVSYIHLKNVIEFLEMESRIASHHSFCHSKYNHNYEEKQARGKSNTTQPSTHPQE